MRDLQATLDAIDELAVHPCGYCSKPLPADGESLDYCDDRCQAAWLAEKHEVQELVGYREPYDLPVYQSNLVELDSPETTPARPDWPLSGFAVPLSGRSPLAQLVAATFTLNVTVDTSRMRAAFERANEAIECFAERVRGITPDFVIFDEIANWQPVGIRNEPTVSVRPEPEEPFGSDFDFEWTPATSLPHQPPAAVMPPAPKRDWQALVDAYSPSTGPSRPVRAPRHLGRTR